MGHVLFGTRAPGTPAPPGAPAPPGTPAPRSWLPSTPANWPLVVGAQQSGPIEVTSGITHTETSFQTVVGPQRADVLDVNLSNPNVRFGVVEAGNELIDPSDETLTSMGDRTGAVAGVNGAYFDIHGTGAPLGMLVQNGTLQASPLTGWPYNFLTLSNGSAAIATETFTGTVTDEANSSTADLDDVNQLGVEANPGLTLVNPAMGADTIPSSVVAQGTVEPGGTSAHSTLKITSITGGVTSLPTLPAGTEDLVAQPSSPQGKWLTTEVGVGDFISVSESTSPYPLQGQTGADPEPYVTAATTGATIGLMADGKILPSALGDPTDIRALTAIGISRDGKHLIVAAFDGIQPTLGLGLNDAEMAGYLKAHGAWSAMAFDSGGSTEMVLRRPGATNVSVADSPSDGSQRPVAQCLCFYSTAPAAGPATSVVVNGGKPLTVLAGTSVPVSSYALDASGNPASQSTALTVRPPGLASISGDMLTASRISASPAPPSPPSGAQRQGRLVATAGAARSSVPLRVVSSLASLSLSPSEPNLSPGATQAFSVSATAPGGGAVTLPLDAVSWSVSPASLGTISPEGVFTASEADAGLVTVTAKAGGAKATASVAVGQVAKVVDSMTDVGNWALNTTEGATGKLAPSTQAPPGASGSMDVSYAIPAGAGVKQVAFSPKTGTDEISPLNGEDPAAIGIWVKGGSPVPSGAAPLGDGALTLAEGYLEVGGQSVVLYPTTVDFDGWTLVEGQLSAGLNYPLSVSFLDLLVIDPTTALDGNVYLSDLEGLYSPRPPAPFHYVAIPKNPPWLQFTEDPARFVAGGDTLASFDDAHVQAADPDGTGSVIVKDIGSQLRGLPANEKPLMVQTQGDMSNNGTLSDLEYLKSLLVGLGIPYHEAVGNHEIGQGVYPENGNFTSVFGPTHYAYTLGAARIIVLDSSHIGVEASDPYQVPVTQTDQYRWLVSQLNQARSKVVFIVTHVPAYDPQPSGDSQFSNRYEAEMYELLAEKYQESHPGRHLILLFGHARGFAETVINDKGEPSSRGIPNFVVADAGAPAYAPADQGGFYNYVLFHVLPDGTVQFAVQPVLASISVSVPQKTLNVGGRERARVLAQGLKATGTSPTGNNLPPIEVPIENPASHYWTSQNPSVARVDRVTGVVIANRPGQARISVTCDGITASALITVTG